MKTIRTQTALTDIQTYAQRLRKSYKPILVFIIIINWDTTKKDIFGDLAFVKITWWDWRHCCVAVGIPVCDRHSEAFWKCSDPLKATFGKFQICLIIRFFYNTHSYKINMIWMYNRPKGSVWTFHWRHFFVNISACRLVCLSETLVGWCVILVVMQRGTWSTTCAFLVCVCVFKAWDLLQLGCLFLWGVRKHTRLFKVFLSFWKDKKMMF